MGLSGTRRTRALLVALTAGAVVSVAVAAPWKSTVDTSGTPVPQAPAPVASSAPESPSPPSVRFDPVGLPSSPTKPAAPTCDGMYAGLSVRDRLAQLVMAGANPSDERQAAAVVRDDHVGGIFIGGNATRLLTGGRLDAVRAASKLPVLVAVDEEGGRVQRIDALDGDLPSARTLAATQSPTQVRADGVRRGHQLAAHGVTMDLAPVADVSAAAAGTVIGDRSFSPDPAVVTRYAGAFANGLRDAGVVPVLKHFPGHGRANGDSHQGLVRTPPLAELETDDLRPYRDLLPQGMPVVMLGHLDVPGLTGGAPASLSPAAYRLLRGEYGFAGVAMTDDLGAMRAVTAKYSLPEAVLKALSAGADLALWSNAEPAAPVLDRLEKAARSGELPESRIHEAAVRILHLKTACT